MYTLPIDPNDPRRSPNVFEKDQFEPTVTAIKNFMMQLIRDYHDYVAVKFDGDTTRTLTLNKHSEAIFKQVVDKGGDTKQKFNFRINNGMEGAYRRHAPGFTRHPDYGDFIARYIGTTFHTDITGNDSYDILSGNVDFLRMFYNFSMIGKVFTEMTEQDVEETSFKREDFGFRTTLQMYRSTSGETLPYSGVSSTAYPGRVIGFAERGNGEWAPAVDLNRYALVEDLTRVESANGTARFYWNLKSAGIRTWELEDGRIVDYDPNAPVYKLYHPSGSHTVVTELPSNAMLIKGSDNLYFKRPSEILSHSSNVLDRLPGFLRVDGEEHVSKTYPSRDNTLYMGVELEVEMSRKATITKSQAVEKVYMATEGRAIVVHDGSLDNGFEIVSVPATLSYHYDIWEELCTGELRKQLVSFIRETCGLHIHMSKNAFTDYTLGMFITFINSPSNSGFVSLIAGRDPQHYCKRAETKITKGKHRDTFVDKSNRSHDKYYATNLLNSKTLEVRMFKGTLAYGGVLKCLEFCHALHKYVSWYASINTLNEQAFLSWFSNKENGCRKSYPYLWEYLASKGKVTEKSKAMLTQSKCAVSERDVDKGEFKPLTKEELAKLLDRDHTKQVQPEVIERFRKSTLRHRITKLPA